MSGEILSGCSVRAAIQKHEDSKHDPDDVARLTSLKVDAEAGKPINVLATFEGDGVKIFAAHMVEWFREQGGDNFITIEVGDPKTGDRFELTMQRAGAKTPAQLLVEMRTLLREIYDADKTAIEELRKMGADITDLYDPVFTRRIEAVLGLPSTVKS